MIFLVALQAPSIVQHTQSLLIAKVGGKVELICRSTGQPSPNVTWFKDDTAVSASLVLASGSLVIDNFQAEDEGLYHCIVSNDVGSVRSPETTLLRSWYKTPIPDLFRAGKIFTLSQKAEIDISNLSATWTVGPVNRQQPKKRCPSPDCPAWVQVTAIDQFTINAVIRLDYSQMTQAFPGHNEFEVNTTLGNLAMRSFTVQFSGQEQGQLDISVPPDNMYVENGKDAVLFCMSNRENATYTWSKDDIPLDLEENDRLSILEEGTLKIARVTAEDYALYTCTVTGPVGTPGTKAGGALLSVYSRPHVSLNKTINSERSGFLLSCHANGSAPMDVDLLCNGETEQTDEAGDELMAEINTDPVLVTKNAVCQCLISGEFGNIQDSVFVNMADLAERPSPSTSVFEGDTDPPNVISDNIPPNLAKDSRDDSLSDGEMVGLIIAVVVFVVVLAVVVIVVILHRRKPQPRQESQRELRTSDIGDPVPPANLLRSMETGSARGHVASEPAAQANSKQHMKPKLEGDDLKRNSRNDFAGTKSGIGLLEYQSIAGSQDSLKESASQRKTSNLTSDIDTSLYGNSDTVQREKDKQTRTSVVALRKDGYVVVEEDMRTQQNVVVELHHGPQTDHAARIPSKPVPVGSGEYARLDPEPHPKLPPPIPPKSATPSSSIPYGIEYDWHFKLNGDEYAIAEVGTKRRSTPSDEGLKDLAYAFSGLPQEEKGEISDSSLMKHSRPQPARANGNVRYDTLMPET